MPFRISALSQRFRCGNRADILTDLTISIKELNLRGNGFRGLPKQLEDRKFARLRRLDLSNNPLGGEWW